MKPFQFAVTAFICFATAQSVSAATTVLTFDEFPSRTEITNQYQELGVTATGVTALDALRTPWPANSGANVASAVDGLMTFFLDPAVTGEITEVSGYVSGLSAVGIYAYDAAGNLVGSSATEGESNNALVTVKSSGPAIATIAIHDSGASFVVDTLTLATTSAPVCSDVAASMNSQVLAMPGKDFKNHQARRKVLEEIAKFNKMLSRNVPNFRLRDQLYDIRKDVLKSIKNTPARTELLKTIQQLLVMVEANQC